MRVTRPSNADANSPSKFGGGPGGERGSVLSAKCMLDSFAFPVDNKNVFSLPTNATRHRPCVKISPLSHVGGSPWRLGNSRCGLAVAERELPLAISPEARARRAVIQSGGHVADCS